MTLSSHKKYLKIFLPEHPRWAYKRKVHDWTHNWTHDSIPTVGDPVISAYRPSPTGVFWSKQNRQIFFYEMRELFVKLYESQKWIPQEFIFDKKTQCTP